MGEFELKKSAGRATNTHLLSARCGAVLLCQRSPSGPWLGVGCDSGPAKARQGGHELGGAADLSILASKGEAWCGRAPTSSSSAMKSTRGDSGGAMASIA